MDSLKGALIKGFFKPGTWNQFKITVDGEKVLVQINGNNALEAVGLRGPEKGYIAIQAEVPNGGKHRFRNIYVTELKDTEDSETTN